MLLQARPISGCPLTQDKVVPVPRCWLMVDARIGPDLPRIAAQMPPRSAIVIRPFALPMAGRAALIRRLRHIARARRHMLIWSGANMSVGFDGRHGTARRLDDGFLVMPVHDTREAAIAHRHHADAVLVSPVYPTRSHPGAASLQGRGFARLAKSARCPAIAMGGMDAKRHGRLRPQGAYGWAAIDGWMNSAAISCRTANQKRNCVPT